MKPFRIEWSIFEGSTHCGEGIWLFVDEKWSFHQWVQHHLPYMKEQAAYVKQIQRNLSLEETRRRARRWLNRK